MALRDFAYGSNMSSARLRERTPTAVAESVARLDGWSLAFDKHGRDGTAKANIVRAQGSRVWGVVFRLVDTDRAALDRVEGLGFAYAERWLDVVTEGSGSIHCLTYTALDILAGLPVAPWYLEHMLDGAREHGLPPDHVALIRQLATA